MLLCRVASAPCVQTNSAAAMWNVPRDEHVLPAYVVHFKM